MSCKFQYGDKVKVVGKSGKIISVRKDYSNNDYICTVKFDNRFERPQEKEYKEYELQLIEKKNGKSNIKNEKKCTCGIEATYGYIPKENHSEYCDLLKKEVEKVAKKDYSVREDEEFLLEQFQMMLNNYPDDDEDDFGFFD